MRPKKNQFSLIQSLSTSCIKIFQEVNTCIASLLRRINDVKKTRFEGKLISESTLSCWTLNQNRESISAISFDSNFVVSNFLS